MKGKPVAFIIFGGTGDLTKRKILPSIYSLYKKELLHPDSYIVGIGRREYSDEEYKATLYSFSPESYEEDIWKDIRITYHKAHFDKECSLQDLPLKIQDLEGGEGYNRLFYLATNYTFMPAIASQLKDVSLDTSTHGFSRVIFEKPFGKDLKSSDALNSKIQKIFPEEKIYRIDHYLGKETVQNLLSLRFCNPLFENIWNSTLIEEIRLVVEEDMAVGARIGYYDTAGAIKDMLQNHLLQVISLVLMDAPADNTPDAIHDEKIKVLKHLHIKDLSVGQYESYREEAQSNGILATNTETLASATLECKTKRWKGTKITLKTGKKLPQKHGYIEIIFKAKPCECSCLVDEPEANRLVINIQPSQDITFHINTKSPFENTLKHVPMSFCHSCEFGPNSVEAYEKLLLDSLHGDKTLFTRYDELRESWKLTDKLVAMKEEKPLKVY
jgi:glucose-6-phosphate 1-dehydrogenase